MARVLSASQEPGRPLPSLPRNLRLTKLLAGDRRRLKRLPGAPLSAPICSLASCNESSEDPMTNKWLKSICSLAAAVLIALPAAQAQTVTGNITGTVTDSSGAVVSNAHVVAHNVGTGVDSPATTNDTGFYRIQSCPPGSTRSRCRLLDSIPRPSQPLPLKFFRLLQST